ncbi:uncharacterized protein [Littorina saxatilis]|uniref:uncharacterized protein isoform X2 n=1 Tax=Littorina saxatilis TaxID=31220 RepID=UPI0038B55A2A
MDSHGSPEASPSLKEAASASVQDDCSTSSVPGTEPSETGKPEEAETKLKENLSALQSPPKQSKRKPGRPRKLVSRLDVSVAEPTTASDITLQPPVAVSKKDDRLDEMSAPSSCLTHDNSFVSPMHSTPVSVSQRKSKDLNISEPGESPIGGRRSGRERKKTVKGESLDVFFKSQGEITNDADNSETLENSSLDQKKTPGKRGRPRKNADTANTSRGAGMKNTKAVPLLSNNKITEMEDTGEDLEIVPVKKKTGRPRKANSRPSTANNISNQSVPSNNNTTEMEGIEQEGVEPEVIVTVIKKRGRPKKVDSSTPTSFTTTSSTANISHQSAPSNNETTEMEGIEQKEEEAAVTVKKKRGHPRKVDSSTPTPSARTPSTPTPSARTPSTRTPSARNNISNRSNITPRSRGQRQRAENTKSYRETSEASDSEHSDAEKDTQQKVLKTGSRIANRKSDSFVNSDASDRTQTPSERGDGPRKMDVISSIAESTEESTLQETEEVAAVVPVKRKMGRSRKNNKSHTEDGDEDLKNQPTNCLRCGVELDNLNSYKLHLRNRHAALYSEECPEGDQSLSAMVLIHKKTKTISCPKCHRPFKNFQYFKHHYLWCGREDEKEQCERCGSVVKAMWMYQHMQEHRKRDLQMAAKKNEKEIKREAAPGDEEMGGHPKRKAAEVAMRTLKEVTGGRGDDDEGRQPRAKRKKVDDNWVADGIDDAEDDDAGDEGNVGERWRKYRPPGGGEGRDEMCGARKISFRRVPTQDFFLEHEKHLKQLGDTTLHGDLLPLACHWSPLDESEAAAYLPVSKESPEFSLAQYNNKKDAQPRTLQWSQTLSDDYQATAFAGGPVRSVKWCPLGVSATRRQVLAVAAGKVMWKSQEIFTREEESGCIQFWSTGTLDGRRPMSTPDLRLSFTLAHSQGHVVSMAWCPRLADIPHPPSGRDVLQRLGLLAVAGFDSSVLVYSIPTPESLSGQQTEGASNKQTTAPTYRPSPTLTLACVNPEVFGPCLSVSWQKGDNCEFIAGGFAHGFVHIWHLSTSPREGLSGNTLSPVRTFHANTTAVLTIDWSWTDPTNFLTGGLDGWLKIWDAQNTSTYLSILPWVDRDLRGAIRSASFGCAVMDGLVFADDQRHRYSGAVYGVDLVPPWVEQLIS